jgi:cell division protein ZapA (FtsZ GTPase activity inhibitor)
MTAKKAEKSPETPASAEVYSTKLTLCGETVQLRTDQSPEVVQRLAGYINAKVRAAGGGTGLTPDNFRMLALASLGIAGELFETKAKLEDHEKAHHGMLAKAQSLTDSLDRALATRD